MNSIRVVSQFTACLGLVFAALALSAETPFAAPYEFRDFREVGAALDTFDPPGAIDGGPRLTADEKGMSFSGAWVGGRISYSSLRERWRPGADQPALEDGAALPHGDEKGLIPARPLFVRTLRGEKGPRYLISTHQYGVLATAEGGTSFSRWEALPRRFLPVDYRGPVLYRDVLDVWQNPERPRQLLVLNKHDLLLTVDGGASFEKIDLAGVKDSDTFATVAARTDGNGRIRDIYLGTAFNGIFRLELRGTPGAGKLRTSREARYTSGLPARPHDGRITFYEEISGIVVDAARGRLIATTLFSGSICTGSLDRTGLTCNSLPGLAGEDSVDFLLYDAGAALAYAGTNRGVYVYGLDGVVPDTAGRWAYVSTEDFYGSEPDADTTFLGRFAAVEGRTGLAPYRPGRSRVARTDLRGFYISPTTARSKRPRIYEMVNSYGYNAAVIDVKDDFGRLIYGSKLEAARAMNNDFARAPIAEIVAELKQRKIYTIARQVVFKDNQVNAFRGHKYAIRDVGGGAWGMDQEERWVDTYSVWVHNYNVRVAQEVLALGFDEIQFDYIRFPSDGPIGRCRWSHQVGDAYKSEALESFLRKARSQIDKPISVDVYGYNAIYRAGGVIGQDVHDLGDYIDVLSPMHYSSHFGPRYMRDVPRDRRAFELLKLGCERPVRRGRGLFQVRPWLQAFEMMGGTWGRGAPYMESQILGSLEGGCKGFLFWGPLARFTVPGRVQNRLYGTTDHLFAR